MCSRCIRDKSTLILPFINSKHGLEMTWNSIHNFKVSISSIICQISVDSVGSLFSTGSCMLSLQELVRAVLDDLEARRTFKERTEADQTAEVNWTGQNWLPSWPLDWFTRQPVGWHSCFFSRETSTGMHQQATKDAMSKGITISVQTNIVFWIPVHV